MLNEWEQQRAVMDEMLRMEREGLVRCLGKDEEGIDRWENTELLKPVVLAEMKEEFGVWAPLVRLFDRLSGRQQQHAIYWGISD
jgi:hypothetical protein